MAPLLTRLTTPARTPLLSDCDPARSVASQIFDDSLVAGASELSLHRLSIHPPFEDELTCKCTLRLAHAPSGRRFEADVLNRTIEPKSNPSEVASDQLPEFSVYEIVELMHNQACKGYEMDLMEGDDARLCEAVLRSVFALSIPVQSLEDRLQDAEIVKKVFNLPAAVQLSIDSRALKAARYRRAELQLLYDALLQDHFPLIDPDSFEDLSHYELWKKEELQELSLMIKTLIAFPSFSGAVQVDILTVDDLKAANPSCFKAATNCGKTAARLQVYCSVTLLPAKSSENFEEGPAFLTDIAESNGSAQWQAASPWIPVTSVQDKLLVEVWDRRDNPLRYNIRTGFIGKIDLRNIPFISKHKSRKRRKLSSWNGDPFLGQVIVSFSHIEFQALSEGVMQGRGPVVSYMLTDEKGQQKSSNIQLQFACSCEHFYRDIPPNKQLLESPIDNIESAYDTLVSLAFRNRKEGCYGIGMQWRKILNGFGNHYRIRRLRCSLGIVLNLAQMFQDDWHYLIAIVDEWLPVCEAAKDGRLTKEELAIHSDVVSLLVKPAIEAIESFLTIFSGNQPRGALPYLLNLLGLVLRWDPNPNEIIVPIKSWIKNCCERRFYQHLYGNAGSENEPIKITVRSLTKVVKLIRRDLSELLTSFVNTFPDAISLSELSIPTYYKLVSAYVLNTMHAADVKLFTKDHEDLATELLLFHAEIAQSDQECEYIDLHSLFHDHILQLISTAKTRMIDWISSCISTEKWEPLSLQSGALFSFSAVDLYFMIGEVIDEMLTRLASIPSSRQYFQFVEDSISTAIKTYVEILEKLCLQELPEESARHKHVMKKDTEVSSDLCISRSLCVKMNDVFVVLEKDLDLEERLNTKWKNMPIHVTNHGNVEHHLRAAQEDDNDASGVVEDSENAFGKAFKEIQQFTKQTVSNVIDSIVEILKSQIFSELQYILQEKAGEKELSSQQQLYPLTSHMDEHLSIMNDFLHPTLFKQILRDVAEALLFCMEEFALNRDEDPSPMTSKQRQWLEGSLPLFYDYFDGGGLGLSNEEMDVICARLRIILACWDIGTRELCALYWKAWDKFNDEYVQDQTAGFKKYDDPSRYQLHLLDYLWLLRQRKDDEAKEIVERQNSIANKKLMQFMFGLPREEELVASFLCRNARKVRGTLYITAKHICFADFNMTLAASRQLVVLQIDRVMRIDVSENSSILFIPFNHRPVEFTKFADRDAVCRLIFSQVLGTGLHLEKSMAPFWAGSATKGLLDPASALRNFRCRRQALLCKYHGTLAVSTTYLVFTQDDKQKQIQIDHGSILSIHAERRGLRPSGVVVELKNGGNLEFSEFEGVNVTLKEVAQELHSLILSGSQHNHAHCKM